MQTPPKQRDTVEIVAWVLLALSVAGMFGIALASI